MARTLFSRGFRGAIVNKIQKALRQEGYYTGTLDGLYGGGTERAVRPVSNGADLGGDGQGG